MSSGRTARTSEEGIVLLGALVVALLLSVLGAALLNVAGQETLSAAAGRDAVQAQQLADGAGDIVIAWFHSPNSAPVSVSQRLAKQHINAAGSPSYFDPAGRSQFAGTAERPDLSFAMAEPANGQGLNGTAARLFSQADGPGTIHELKFYGPSKPGLLGTIDVTVGLRKDPSVRQSVRMQVGAVELPAIRAAVQTGQSLGITASGRESPVEVHWGDLSVAGDLAVRRLADVPVMTAGAMVTGQGYDGAAIREDRWATTRVGGELHVTLGSSEDVPMNVRVRQNPTPGVRLDRWSYEYLKRVARQHGSYFAIDREGLLYPQGVIEPGRGLTPDTVLRSNMVGDQRGLVFIDTLDQTAPRSDNLGVVALSAPYMEAHLVVAGHIVLRPASSTQMVRALSPPVLGSDQVMTRIPVQLSGVHINGALYAAGNIILEQSTKIYGTVTAEGTIGSAGHGSTLEVWYDHDMGQGAYRGVPVVYRAPGTWMVR